MTFRSEVSNGYIKSDKDPYYLENKLFKRLTSYITLFIKILDKHNLCNLAVDLKHLDFPIFSNLNIYHISYGIGILALVIILMKMVLAFNFHCILDNDPFSH